MSNELIYSEEKDPSLNTVYYGIAKQVLNELFDKRLISQAEFYEIDDLNQRSFFQETGSEN